MYRGTARHNIIPYIVYIVADFLVPLLKVRIETAVRVKIQDGSGMTPTPIIPTNIIGIAPSMYIIKKLKVKFSIGTSDIESDEYPLPDLVS